MLVAPDGGILVDDCLRVMHWVPKAAGGTVVADGNGLGDQPGQFNNPSGVAVAPNGGILVVDG